MAAIEARALRVRRGGNVVLRDVSLDVQAGLVTGLLGPSGSGKTTLMRAIVGVQIVEAGEVTVLGAPAAPNGRCASLPSGVREKTQPQCSSW